MRFFYLLVLILITSVTYGVSKSLCKVCLETYQGTLLIILSIFDWNVWRILVLDGLLHPRSSIPYDPDGWQYCRLKIEPKNGIVWRSLYKLLLHQSRDLRDVLNDYTFYRHFKTVSGLWHLVFGMGLPSFRGNLYLQFTGDFWKNALHRMGLLKVMVIS